MAVSWGALIQGLGSLYAGKMGADATSEAAGQQAASSAQAMDLQRLISNRDYNSILPFLQGGYGALAQLQWGMGIDPRTSLAGISSADSMRGSIGSAAPEQFWVNINDFLAKGGDSELAGKQISRHQQWDKEAWDRYQAEKAAAGTGGAAATPGADYIFQPQGDFGWMNEQFEFTKDPSYDAMLNEAQTAIEKSAAARGGLFSGATGKAMTKYAQDYAGSKYNEAWNRWNAGLTGRYNRMANLAGMGQTATNQVIGSDQNYGNTMAGLLTSAGNNQAAAPIARTNAWGDALSGLGKAFASTGGSSDKEKSASNAINWNDYV